MTPVRKEGYKFCEDVCIPCFQTSDKSLLKPAAFMDLAQEIAYWAATELGFGYDTLHIHHAAWVLVRMHIHFAQPVSWRDHVTLCTWHKGAGGLTYLRDFDLRNEAGESAVLATSSWVVMDDRTRRFVRPEDLKTLLDPGQEVAHAIATPAPKVSMPQGTAVPVGLHQVAFSDLDINGHTNNARYAVWAMDCLPLEVAERPMKDLYVNFNKETVPGESVQLFRLQDGDTWYVEGKVDGKSCFVIKMVF